MVIYQTKLVIIFCFTNPSLQFVTPGLVYRFKCRLVLAAAGLRMQLTINLMNGNLRSVLIFGVLWTRKCSFLDYYVSKLSLVAREIMRLLANNQLISLLIQSKTISLEKIWLLQKISSYCRNFIILSSLLTSKTKT